MIGLLPTTPLRDFPAPTPQAKALQRDLAPLVGGRASVASQDRIAASRDLWARTRLWAGAGFAGPAPDVVAWPSSADEVAAVVRKALVAKVPVVAYGGGTGGAGAVVPERGGIALDLKRLNRVLALDVEAREVEVEAGVVGEALERRLARAGLTTGHYPEDARAATVGGWVATRSAGWAAGRCGRFEDLVATLSAVDGQGQLLCTPRRPAPGWDLARLLAGSEGTLALICSARLHLLPLPPARIYQAWRFRSLREGLEAARALYRSGLRPAALRLSDPTDSSEDADEPALPVGRRGALRRRFDEAVTQPLHRLAARATAAAPRGLNAAARALRSCLLVLQFEGPEDLCDLEAEEASRLCLAARAEDLGADVGRAWLDRRWAAIFQASRAWDEGTFVDVLDVFCTWDQAWEVHRRVRAALAPLALLRARVAGGYPEGCALEFSVTAAADALEQAVERHDEIWRRGLAAARSAGAVGSHHGGVGLQRLNAFKGQAGEGLRVLRALKATFDPAGILNPGKLGA